MSVKGSSLFRHAWKPVLVIGVLALAALFLLPSFLYPHFKTWAESPAGQALFSKEVSKALKVEGEFQPLTLDGLVARSAEFTSQGWPGEAIGGLDAYGIKAVFDPWGVFRSVWQIDTIEIDRGTFYLRDPNDALKRTSVKKPRPWYAWLMPQYFNIRWIQCPRATVEFPFQGQTGRLKDMELGATMIKQDFKYYGYNGTLEFPLLPELAIDKLMVFITREMADVESAELRGLDGDPARVWLSARLGMRGDKSLKGRAVLTAVPFTQTLPETLRDRLTGRVSGEVRLETDATGQNTTSSGRLRLIDTQLSSWPWLDNLARLQKNPELKEFVFENAAWDYDYRDKRFAVSVLDVRLKEKLHLKGAAVYDWTRDRVELDMDFDEMPVSTWIPEAFKARVYATLRGHLQWKGSFKDWKQSEGSGQLNMDGAWMKNPLKRLPVPDAYKRGWQEEVYLEKANAGFAFQDRTFDATQFEFSAKDVFTLKGRASWSLENVFTARTSFRFNQVEAWVPPIVQNKLEGDLSGTLNWACEKWDFAKGRGDGDLLLEGGRLKNFRFQQILTRFLKDKSFLKLDLEPVRVTWKSVPEGIAINDARVFSPGKCGLTGNILIRPDGALSGTVKVGARAADLTWLPNATGTVFKEQSGGLYWATVKLSGTVEKPQHNLTTQVMKQLGKHPFKLAGLALRGLSWWMGNALGTYEAPKTP